jgi:hypothetical protein
MSPLRPVLKFKSTLANQECLHHRIRMIGIAVCPYCNEPSLEEVQRRNRRATLAGIIASLVAWLFWLTWRVW